MTADVITTPTPSDVHRARAADADQTQTSPPAAKAPFSEREAWCQGYAEWLIAHLPDEETPPDDVRPSQRFENEFNSCKLDPKEYQRQTRHEVANMKP